MTLSPRRGSGRIDAADPIAVSLRGVLHTDPLTIVASERRAEVKATVVASRLAATLDIVEKPPTWRRRFRRRIAEAVLALGRRLAADTFEIANDCC
jgi:acyl-CoA reductase-like NAD-dependent aldehyde dehydrogenase